MVPDEEPKAPSESTQSSSARGPRRSRRGGRRHSRRRGPRPSSPSPGEAEAAAPDEEPTRIEAAEATEEMAPPDPAPAESYRESDPEPKGSAVSQAIEQVTHIIEDLKRVLEEMEETLETLELAERQKIDDERELDSLQRALRQLRHSHSHSGREERHR